MINFAPIYDQIPADLRRRLLVHFDDTEKVDRIRRDIENLRSSSVEVTSEANLYSVDEDIIIQVLVNYRTRSAIKICICIKCTNKRKIFWSFFMQLFELALHTVLISKNYMITNYDSGY